MRITAVSADAVATNAIGGGALIVTRRAGQNVAPRRSPVEVQGLRIGAHPLERMWVAPVDETTADAARRVAALAATRLVTALTFRRLGSRLDGVNRQEIAAMNERPLDTLRHAPLDRESLYGVVASVAVGLRVARLTELLLSGGGGRVPAREVLVMSQKRARQGRAEVALVVAGSALGAFPLLLVFVASETLAHRRDGRALGIHDASVAADALSLNRRHREVLGVIEQDGAARAARRDFEHRGSLRGVALMAAGAHRNRGKLVLAALCRRRVAGVAAQAFSSAARRREVRLVREASGFTLDARRYDRGREHEEP